MASTRQPTLKQQFRDVIDQLPDNCTAEDIHYELYLIEKIRRGEASLKRDGGIDHQEVRRRAAAWAAK
jgi:hypothetical protein